VSSAPDDSPWLPPEVWEAAADDSVPGGFARVGGSWLDLDAFLAKLREPDLTPFRREILNQPAGALAAEDTYQRMVAARCHAADRCVMDAGCPFVADCLLAEAE
jgi:hypothetical protein